MNKVALRPEVVRKQVSFQDRKEGNTSKLPMHRNISSLLTVLKINLRYLEHFHKKNITAIQSIRFEIHLRSL